MIGSDPQGGSMARSSRRPAPTSLLTLLALFIALAAAWAGTANERADRIRNGWKDIAGPALMNTVIELCLEKYAGRLTGTRGYDDAADWVAGRLAGWGLA